MEFQLRSPPVLLPRTISLKLFFFLKAIMFDFQLWKQLFFPKAIMFDFQLWKLLFFPKAIRFDFYFIFFIAKTVIFF